MPSGNVKGVLFADYVRMLRLRKDIDWSQHLDAADLALVMGRVAADAWYPMDAFERLGVVILQQLAGSQLGQVRLFGRVTVDALIVDQPFLLAKDDPVETVNRFRGLRATWFDFEALTVPVLHEDECEITVQYGMGATAEEAAVWQTVGFFERLLEVAGAEDVKPGFHGKSWLGQKDRTHVRFQWKSKF